MSPSLLFCNIHLNQSERVKRYALRDGLHLRGDALQLALRLHALVAEGRKLLQPPARPVRVIHCAARERRTLLRRRVRVGQRFQRRGIFLLRVREVAADVLLVPRGDRRAFQQLVREAERKRRRGARRALVAADRLCVVSDNSFNSYKINARHP